MQAAIDRVLRSFSFRPAVSVAEDVRQELSREDAAALASRLLENYKGQLARSAAPRN